MMDAVWLWSDRLTILFALLAAIFSCRTWVRTTRVLKSNRIAAERRKAPITIQLASSNPETGEQQIFQLPYQPRRNQLSRAELTGLLSFYCRDKGRYNNSILRQIMEDGTLERVLAGENDRSSDDETLTIRCDWQSFLAFHPRDEQPVAAETADENFTPASFQIDLVESTPDVTSIRIRFSDTVATNERLVVDANEATDKLSLEGGKLLKINGPCSLPVAMTIAHAVGHKFAAVAVFDPKLSKHVVAISHDPSRPIGTLL